MLNSEFRNNAFPLAQNRVNLTSGNIQGTAKCSVDGSLLVTWKDGSQDTINTLAGDTFDLTKAKTVSITTGTFHTA